MNISVAAESSRRHQRDAHEQEFSTSHSGRQSTRRNSRILYRWLEPVCIDRYTPKCIVSSLLQVFTRSNIHGTGNEHNENEKTLGHPPGSSLGLNHQ